MLVAAIVELARSGLKTKKLSRFYSTPAFPKGSGPDFVNAAMIVESELSAADQITILHDVEAKLGRVRLNRWGQRSIDLDLLACGDLICPDRTTYDRWRNLSLDQQVSQAPDQLILPHPRMHERGFVLIPLLDVAPNWRHPVSGQTVRAMVAALSTQDIESVHPL